MNVAPLSSRFAEKRTVYDRMKSFEFLPRAALQPTPLSKDPFYEDVVLRHLEAAGSRLNVVLVDGAELAKAFCRDTRPNEPVGTTYWCRCVRPEHCIPRLFGRLME